MFHLLEPVFDGSLIRLPRSKELICPGTFVFYSRALGEDGGDSIDVGRIMRSPESTNGSISLNIFRPPLPEEQIRPLHHSTLSDVIEVVQTTEVVELYPCNIIDVAFVFPCGSIMDHSNMLEVSGMELVRVLRGRVHENIFEEVFPPSFPSSYDSFFQSYHANDDLCYRKWSEVVLPIQALISRLLCRAFIGQGDNFCKHRSEAHQFTRFQWGWLSSFFMSHGTPSRNVALFCRSKRLLVRPTAVFASSVQSACSIIRCETEAELKAVKLLFGKCCLVGLRDVAPSVQNSVLLQNSQCNVIIPNDHIENPFVLNTSRLGIDFEFSGTVLRVTVRYKKVFGTDAAVRGLFPGEVQQTSLRNTLPATQNLKIVSVNSFFKLDDGELAYVVSIGANGLCHCREAQGEFPQDHRLPYETVSRLANYYCLEQLQLED